MGGYRYPRRGFEETVRAHSVDSSIVPYNEYIQAFEQVYPDRSRYIRGFHKI